VGSRWRIRRFRTGPQSEPRGHVSSTRSPVAGVALASEGVRSVPPVTPALHSRAEDSRAAERQRPSGHVRAHESAASRRAWRNNRNRSGPRSPRAPDEPSATLEWSLDGTSSSGFVVDHTVRPRPAVPSRERTPAGHDQHRRPARNPSGRPDQTGPSLRSEHYLAHAVADQRARIHRYR